MGSVHSLQLPTPAVRPDSLPPALPTDLGRPPTPLPSPMQPPAGSRGNSGAGSSQYSIPTTPPTTMSQQTEPFIPAEVVIPNFSELQVPAHLMSTNANFGVLDATLAEANKIRNASAYRFQGIGPGSLPLPPQPIAHQNSTKAYSLFTNLSRVVNLTMDKRFFNRR